MYLLEVLGDLRIFSLGTEFAGPSPKPISLVNITAAALVILTLVVVVGGPSSLLIL